MRTGPVTLAAREKLRNVSPKTQKFDPLTPTMFHHDWWLKAASDGNYDEAIVKDGDRIVGRFPYVLSRTRNGSTLSRMPELTHFLGPAIDDGTGAACNRALKRADIMRELLDRMPKTSVFFHKMHAGVTDMMVFQQYCHEVSVQFTYEIAPAPLNVLWSNMRDKTRNVIRRASESLTVQEMTDPDEYISYYNGNLRDRGVRNFYKNATIRRVAAESLRRDHGRIIAAYNEDGKIAAAIFYVWDERRAYYLMTTRAKYSGNGAVSLLIWNALRDCSERSLIFDFDGVGGSGSILFFTGFGGQVMPRYIARSSTIWYGVMKLLIRPFRGREHKETF